MNCSKCKVEIAAESAINGKCARCGSGESAKPAAAPRTGFGSQDSTLPPEKHLVTKDSLDEVFGEDDHHLGHVGHPHPAPIAHHDDKKKSK